MALHWREVCSLRLRTRYRDPVAFTVTSVGLRHLERIYLVASRAVAGMRGLSFTVGRRTPRSEIIASAAFLACCWARREEVEDARLLASVGAEDLLPEGLPAPPGRDGPELLGGLSPT